MLKANAYKIAAIFCVIMLLIGYMPVYGARKASGFVLTAEEKAYLDTLRDRPVTIAYSYDLVAAEYDGVSYSMLDPIFSMLGDEFGLTVSRQKISWHDALESVESGDIDLYGPIAISGARRQKYITVDPFYRSYSKVMTRVSEPVSSMNGLYNRTIGLMEGSVISRTMQAYQGPEGGTVYFPTMDAMIEGLQSGLIDAFASVDNAEFEILSNDDIRSEFSIENFYADQGLISGKEELRPLVELINRYISENKWIPDKVAALRNEALIQYTKERFKQEISYLQANYDEIPIFVEPILYPLCYEEDGIEKGMQTEINEVFTKITGIPVRLASGDEFPSGVASATELLESGECLAVVGAYHNIDSWNNSSVEYSPILWMDTIRTYSRKDSDGLEGKRLGTTPFSTDYLGWNNTTGNTPAINGSRKMLLEYLKSGELDAVFIGEMTFNYEYSINKDYSLREVEGLTAEASMHMLYGTQNKEFNALFNESMNLYHIMEPKALGEWKMQSDKYKSDFIRMRYTQQIWTLVAGVVFSLMVITIIFLMLKNLRGHKKTIELMKILNEKDVLTGIYNRRYMDVNLDKTIQVLSRSSSPLSVFMVDIDFFKLYNDTYGHGKGDECLKKVADAIKEAVRRDDDFVVRYGGEEFAVVLPHTDEAGAHTVAKKILEAVKSLNIPHEKSKSSKYVSISMGFTTGTAEHTQMGIDYLNRADEALYISKRGGRNKYTFLNFEEAASEQSVTTAISENAAEK